MARSSTSISTARAKRSASDGEVEYLYTKRRKVDLTSVSDDEVGYLYTRSRVVDLTREEPYYRINTMTHSSTSISVARAKPSASDDELKYLYTRRHVVDLTREEPYYCVNCQKPLAKGWLLKSCGCILCRDCLTRFRELDRFCLPWQDPCLSEGPAPCLKFHRGMGPQDVVELYPGDCGICQSEDSGDNERRILPCALQAIPSASLASETMSKVLAAMALPARCAARAGAKTAEVGLDASQSGNLETWAETHG
ncbi:hypothetical protein PG991_001760 [Apiospora marii]|uniref:RING-type domain-containing protein n=1 Tax=Apiospora marii TaxID=335849 RepID=A0ABR1SQL0_9PEZI